jgi:hypothetical protein
MRTWTGSALLAAIALAVAACAHQRAAQLAPVGGVRAALVDSIPWKSDEDEGFLRRIQVRSGNAVDTIPTVLTAQAPVVVGTRVLGFAYRDDEIVGAFEYDAARKALRREALPPGFNGYFSAPSIAPDGRHIAYVVIPGNATAQAVVGAWPGGAPIWKSRTVEIPATDMTGGNLTRWLSADTAEVFIESGKATGEQWLHLLYSVRRGPVRADTVRQLPSARGYSAYARVTPSRSGP